MTMQPTAENQLFASSLPEEPPTRQHPKGPWFFAASLAAHVAVLGILWLLSGLLPSTGNGDIEGVVITLTYGKPGSGSAGEAGGGAGLSAAAHADAATAEKSSPPAAEPDSQGAKSTPQEHKKKVEHAEPAAEHSQSAAAVPRLAAKNRAQTKSDLTPRNKAHAPHVANQENSPARKEKSPVSSEATHSSTSAMADLARPVGAGAGEGHGSGLGKGEGHGQAEVAGTGQGHGSGSSGEGNGAASEGQGDAGGYLKGNYEYIKKRIRKYLEYSPQAKRMGIQGMVYVAFTITRDGSAQNVELRSSSGFASLDESAIEAVHRASPFSPPPQAARVVVPIQFSLK